MPMFFDIFFDKTLICSLHVRCSSCEHLKFSRWYPGYSLHWLSMLTDMFLSIDIFSFLFVLEQNKIKFVFSRFNDSLFALNHSPTSFNLALILLASSPIDPSDINTLVSSANITKLSSEDVLEKSFTYIRNNKGPNTEPCSTPQVTLDTCDVCPLYETLCFLFLK